MNLYLGIDGGGTRTRAILVDAHGGIHGEGEAGPANYHNVGLEGAATALRQAAGNAWRAAGVPFGPAAACFAGLAGVKAGVDLSRLSDVATTVGLALPGRVTVANDLHNALAGGLAGRPGVALIAGTGTNCLARDADGATFMCGGWGWLLDDRGGGIGLALAGLRAATRAADGRGAWTELLPAALAFFGLDEPDQLLARLYVPPVAPGEVAPFAQTVTRLAAAGDAVAIAVLDEGAAALAELVAGAVRKLTFPERPEVVILGGCARSGAPYQPRVERAVCAAVPGAKLVEPVYPPHYGAALNVLAAAGENMPDLLRPFSARNPVSSTDERA